MAKEVDGDLYPDDREPYRVLDAKPDFRIVLVQTLPTFDPKIRDAVYTTRDGTLHVSGG